MRRALKVRVPPEMLGRKRKGYSVRSTALAVCTQSLRAMQPGEALITSSLGIVDQVSLLRVIEDLQTGHDVPLIPLLRTLSIEIWLRTVLAPDQSCNSVTPTAGNLRFRHATGFNKKGQVPKAVAAIRNNLKKPGAERSDTPITDYVGTMSAYQADE